MNNLPEIRDIYVPEGVSFFPLAYGWWVVLGGVVFFLIVLKFVFWGVRKSRKYYALKKLKQISIEEPLASAIAMSELLRRICAFKYKEANSLYGDEWIKFLNKHTSYAISDKAASLLIYAPFMQRKDNSYDIKTAEELKEFCKHWIGANL